MVRVLKFRALIFLSLLYLGLVALLYHFLWRKHGLEQLFETPGQQNSGTASDNYYDYSNQTGSDNEFVQFNFKRQNGPHLLPEVVNDDGLEKENLKRKSRPPRIPLDSLNRTLVVRPAMDKVESRSSQNRSPKTSVTSNTMLNTSNVTSRMSDDHLEVPIPNYCLHAFYYMWYGNTEVNGRYLHWNHKYLPHWDDKITKKYPTGRHHPPDDIGANFYPELGCYSSGDPATMEAHMVQLRKAGVGVIAVSWYPSGTADDEGSPPDPLVSQLLNIAQKYAIKVAFHIEPYHNRTPQSVRKDLEYIHKQYSSHPAVYKIPKRWQNGKSATETFLVVYIYDSYLSPAQEWGQVFRTSGRHSVRGTELDCVAISLLVEQKHRQFIIDGGFDGFYTYFASDGFVFGSSTTNWPALSAFAKEHQLLFIPSFGPGYEDTRVRPWNSKNSKARRNGEYYRAMFGSALKHHHGGLLSITSFNEWHEGTQIESAVPKTGGSYTYLDYAPHSPNYYLDTTMGFSQQLDCSDSEIL